MKLTAEQVVENWETLLKVIENNFEGDRKEKLLKLHQDFSERLMYMPASYKDYYHSCYPGGYVVHVLNVIKNSILLDKLWTENGQNKKYTDEELIFAALTHDLGKLGDLEHSYYEESNDEWRKKRGELYKINEELTYMSIPHRSLFLLSQYDIKVSQSENIAILLHYGLYDEANEQYLKTYFENKRLRDNLPMILHHADMMAMTIERDQYYEELSAPKKSKSTATAKLSKEAQSVFTDFFGKK